MGRIDRDVQGGGVELHQSPVTIDEDLYEPPPPTSTNYRSTPPHQFPPPPADEEDYNKPLPPQVHQFPPPPPVDQEDNYINKPPPQHVHQFPPPPPPVFTPPPQQVPHQIHQQYGIPIGLQQNQLPIQLWKTDLFDCMENPQNALITCFFPCVTFGQIAEIVDSGSTSCGTSGMVYSLIACCIAMPCIMSCTYRTKLRSKFGLAESPAPDCLVHCFCECCALCQEYRELEKRGFDPSIGWLGNVAKQQQQQQQPFGMMIPPQQQRMF